MTPVMRPVRRRFTGTPADLAPFLSAVSQRGELVWMGNGVRLPDGRIELDADLLVPAGPTTARKAVSGPQNAAGTPRALPGDPGWTPRQRPVQPVVQGTARKRSKRRPVVATGVAVAGIWTLGALAWATVTAGRWVLDHWQILLGVVAALAVLAAVAARLLLGNGGERCVTVHRPGCH